MAKIVLDDGKVYKIIMRDKDFRYLLVKGADAVCGELEEIYEQNDYLTVVEIANLEHEYDVLSDLRNAMIACPMDCMKTHRIDGTINGSYHITKRHKSMDGEDDE